MDKAELLRLLNDPTVVAAIQRIALPARTVVGVAGSLPAKGYRMTTEPTQWAEKEG